MILCAVHVLHCHGRFPVFTWKMRKGCNHKLLLQLSASKPTSCSSSSHKWVPPLYLVAFNKANIRSCSHFLDKWRIRIHTDAYCTKTTWFSGHKKHPFYVAQKQPDSAGTKNTLYKNNLFQSTKNIHFTWPDLLVHSLCHEDAHYSNHAEKAYHGPRRNINLLIDVLSEMTPVVWEGAACTSTHRPKTVALACDWMSFSMYKHTGCSGVCSLTSCCSGVCLHVYQHAQARYCQLSRVFTCPWACTSTQKASNCSGVCFLVFEHAQTNYCSGVCLHVFERAQTHRVSMPYL